mgnify:FL=1
MKAVWSGMGDMNQQRVRVAHAEVLWVVLVLVLKVVV